MNREELVAAARTAAQNAYSPYSHFRVGAVVVSSDGQTFTGANIENAAYPSCNCAEATAIHTAVAAGVGSYPCGRCRQIMAEFGVETVIVAAGQGSETRVHTLDELLPFRFTI